MVKHHQPLSQCLLACAILYKPTKTEAMSLHHLAPFGLARVFLFSFSTFLDVSAVGGVVAGCLGDGALLAHQKRHLESDQLVFIFV